MSETLLYNRVAVIGLGLIGSSLCHRMKRDGLAGHVAGHARSAATRDTAMKIGFLDSVHDTAAEAAADADLIVLCVPVGPAARFGQMPEGVWLGNGRGKNVAPKCSLGGRRVSILPPRRLAPKCGLGGRRVSIRLRSW